MGSYLKEVRKHKGAGGEPTSIKWNSKDLKGIILNVDESSLGNPGRAGYGILFRSTREWITGAFDHIG